MIIFFFSFNSWDEWVSEIRVLKFNDANIQKQAELLEQHSAIAAKNKKGKTKSLECFHSKPQFNLTLIVIVLKLLAQNRKSQIQIR